MRKSTLYLECGKMALPKDLFVWGLTIFAAFGGFMFGYDIG